MQQLQELARDAAGRALNQNDTTTMKNGFSAYTNLVDNIRRLLATTRGNNDGHNAVYAMNVDLKQAVAKNGSGHRRHDRLDAGMETGAYLQCSLYL